MILPHAWWVSTPSSNPLADDTKFNSGKQFFSDSVAYADHLVGGRLMTFDDLGIGDDTLVLFMGDNGTSRSIESYVGQRVVQGGKRTTRDAGTHVPLFARWIGTVTSGAVNSDLIDYSDFYATLADLRVSLRPARLTGAAFCPSSEAKFPTPGTGCSCTATRPRQGARACPVRPDKAIQALWRRSLLRTA